MARSAQIQLLLISVLTARAALGQRPPQGPQNSDLSILVGPVIATQAIADANVPVHFNGVSVCGPTSRTRSIPIRSPIYGWSFRARLRSAAMMKWAVA